MRKCDAGPNPMRRHFNIKPNIYFMVVRERSGTNNSANGDNATMWLRRTRDADDEDDN